MARTLTEGEDFRKQIEAKHQKDLADERVKAETEFQSEKASLNKELAAKTDTLRDLKEKELALRRERQQLQEEKEGLELEVQRKIDEERKVIQKQVEDAEAEKFRLREAEYRKKLEDAQRANEDLSRKLEQGSQQLRGEVLELELEKVLKESFPHDKIEAVRKGVRGADVLQLVITPSGQECGTIIWEAKRAENWSAKWVQKLKDDQLEAKADLAAIVTTSFPEGLSEPFSLVDDIWVVGAGAMKPVAQILREMLIEAHKLKLVSTGKSEKMELLYNYMCSAQFAQRVRAVVETFVSMRKDLDQEKTAVQRIWKKREGQLDRVATAMSGMVGELQAIAEESLPQLERIDQLSLPDREENDE